MLFAKETRAVQTEVRQIQKGMTLITSLLRTFDTERSYFSIAVVLFSEADGGEDARLIEDITGDTELAHSLFRLIVDGTVTPCTLTDVLEDHL